MPPVVNRAARLLPHICLLLAILAPATLIAIMTLASDQTLAMGMNIPEGTRAQIEISWQRRLIATLILLLPTGCLSYALTKARSSLRQFNRGEYFSASSIRGIRGFGAGIFWSGLLALAIGPFATMIALGSHATRTLMIRIDVSTLVMLAIGGILWQIASMMQRAAELAEENRQFV